jgi:uncharacterized membrane protein
MATLTVWKFPTASGAADAERVLVGLTKQELIKVHDAAIVSWPTGAKKPRTQQLNSLVGAGALGGMFWGMLFGLIFFIPLLGLAIGAGMGALMGALTDVGIDDSFINLARDKITPGTSALFLYTGQVVQDRVLAEFSALPGNPELIQSNLSLEQEAKLREAFAEEPAGAQPPTAA